MKKFLLLIAICLCFSAIARAQVLPGFQFGIKGGADYSSFPGYGDYKNKDQFGYIGGLWARVGALGFNFQPELYVNSKNVKVTYTEDGILYVNQAKFTSLDLPLLVGGKVGTSALGVRYYTGPVISFAITKNQSFGQATADAIRLDYKDQNYAWQFGAGLDVSRFSLDLRYEAGISKLAYGPDQSTHTRLNLFNVTVAYSLFSIF